LLLILNLYWFIIFNINFNFKNNIIGRIKYENYAGANANAQERFDFVLLILCIIPFGLDKLYKGSVKFFIFKFLLHLLGIGFIWWIYDLVTCIFGKYKVNPFS
jgi:hypothetical protein